MSAGKTGYFSRHYFILYTPAWLFYESLSSLLCMWSREIYLWDWGRMWCGTKSFFLEEEEADYKKYGNRRSWLSRERRSSHTCILNQHLGDFFRDKKKLYIYIFLSSPLEAYQTQKEKRDIKIVYITVRKHFPLHARTQGKPLDRGRRHFMM